MKDIEKISSKIHRPWLRKNKSIISAHVLSYLWSIFAILLYAIYLVALVNHKELIALLSGMWSMSILIDKWFLLKIKADPEEQDVKQVEIQLWEKIKEKGLQGRRTGLGITAEGDMLAALGLRYGTDEATNFSEEVQPLSWLSEISIRHSP